MRRALVALAVLGSSTAAWAGHHCHEVSPIVGYQQCGWFGGWSLGMMASWEAGVSAMRFGADRAAGARSRLAVGLGRTFYVTSQLDFASLTDGSRPSVAALGGSEPMPTPAGGTVVQSAALFGAHRRFGPLTIAAEAGPGVRFASYDVPGSRRSIQGWFVLEVQPKLDLWLTPNISLGAVAGFDAVQHDGYSAALVLGLHVTPYDMAR